jgi:hypothetical protein
MSKDERAKSARRKRREDPVADRKGKGNKPVMVATEAYLEEKNVPTNPELWARAKSMAKSKFDVYPSAYANGWASKWYKSKGGGWKSVNEEFTSFMEENTPSDREWGKTSLTKIYQEATPGQSTKKLKKEDNVIPRGGLPNIGSPGVGPTFSQGRSPMTVGGYGLAESIVNWMNKEETQEKFIEKYGDLAEEKLVEAAIRLQEAGAGRSKSAPKSFGKMKEGLGLGYNDMSPIGIQRKDEVDEESPAWTR